MRTCNLITYINLELTKTMMKDKAWFRLFRYVGICVQLLASAIYEVTGYLLYRHSRTPLHSIPANTRALRDAACARFQRWPIFEDSCRTTTQSVGSKKTLAIAYNQSAERYWSCSCTTNFVTLNRWRPLACSSATGSFEKPIPVVYKVMGRPWNWAAAVTMNGNFRSFQMIWSDHADIAMVSC